MKTPKKSTIFTHVILVVLAFLILINNILLQSLIFGSSGESKMQSYVVDEVYTGGVPFKYYRIGGVAGYNEFYWVIFVVDIIFWYLILLILLLVAKQIYRIVQKFIK